MEQIAKELSLYDLLAYFVTGAVALTSIIFAVEAFLRRRSNPRDMSFFKSDSKLAITSFLIAAYILGNLIQAVASFTDKSVSSRNSIEQHYAGDKYAAFRVQLLNQVNQAFHDPPAEEIFNLCQTYSQTRNIDTYIQIMHGRYAFFRGLAIALLIGSICFGLKSYWDRKIILVWLPVLFVLAMLLSIYRASAYNHYFVDHVYRTFYVSYSLPGTEQKQK